MVIACALAVILLAYANSWARYAGYVITIRRRDNQAKDGTYQRVDLCCDRGGSVREAQATGSRLNASPRKRNCPFSIKVNLIDSLWVPTIVDAAYSHNPSLNEAFYLSHRKKTWTQEQKQEVCYGLDKEGPQTGPRRGKNYGRITNMMTKQRRLRRSCKVAHLRKD